MIIRNGFVSNSSSSSFIIDETSFATSFDLAEHMIRGRDWDKDEATIEKMRKLRVDADCDPHENITFSTCNYDTWIRWCADSKQYAVSTCNNHDYSDLGDSNSLPQELIDEGMIDQEDLEYGIQKTGWFYDIEHDIMIKTPPDDDGYVACNKKGHWGHKLYINGDETELRCVTCYIADHKYDTYSTVKKKEIVEKNRELAKNIPKRVNFRL